MESSGYGLRSRFLLREQLRMGLRPSVATSPFYPGAPWAAGDENFEGIPYSKIPHPVDSRGALHLEDRVCRAVYRVRKGLQKAAGGTPSVSSAGGGGPRGGIKGLLRRLGESWVGRPLLLLEETLLLRRFSRELLHIAQKEGAQLIHAHSPYRNGKPALRVARRLGLPMVYEARGLWEDSAAASGLTNSGSRRHRRWRRRENETLASADAVICLGKEMRREILQRGAPQKRTFVVPNGVDAALFAPAQSQRQPSDSLTVGYVGSLRALEGVDLLLQGVAELRRQGRKVRALIVGEGDALEGLRQLSLRLGLAEGARFTGRVGHEEVRRYYDRMDVVALPRQDWPVTRVVTPLKPLEAMALGKALLVADLPALREIVTDGETGLLHRPGDLAHWIGLCGRLLDDEDERRSFGAEARRWVLANRTWARALEPLPEVYQAAIRAAGAMAVEESP